MTTYYQYWERKIFNALISMTIRALATNKVIWDRDNPMVKQECKYISNEFQYNPPPEEMQTQLQKFTTNILDASLNFGRWYKGFCVIYPAKTGEENADKTYDYSFYEDIKIHAIITSIMKDLTDLVQSLSRKAQLHNDKYLDKDQKKMNDKHSFQKLQKQIERNRSVQYIEHNIMFMKQKKNLIKKKPDKVKMFLILVDYTEVKKSLKDSVKKYLDELGRLLTDIAKGDLVDIQKEIEKFNQHLNKEADSIEEIKFLLETISKIRNTSMDMELKISETQEQFRVLKMYKYPVDKQD